MRRFQRFEKINTFYLDAGAAEAWEAEIARRATGKRFPWHPAFEMHHNPLTSPALSMRWIVERYAPMFRYLDAHPPRRIAEIGAAHGLSTWLLTDVAEEAWGVDVSPEMVEIASTLFPECRFRSEGFEAFFAAHPIEEFDMIIDCYGPWGESLRSLVRDAGVPWLHSGYRAQRFSEVFTWSNKLPGRHLGFETTLVAPGARGIAPDYLRWFFGRRYLQHLKHSVTSGYWPQF
jgi:hypothetical protein